MKSVLGLHCLSHDAGAALVADERLYAISEERLSGVKNDGGFPERSVKYVLEAAGFSGINDVDLVVFDHIDYCESCVRVWLKSVCGYDGVIYAIKHHDAHAASAFHVSPFDEAAVLVVDGGGSYIEEVESSGNPDLKKARRYTKREVQSFYIGSGNELSLVKRTFADSKTPVGIGTLYALSSIVLGFGALGSGKVMGLAAYGGKIDIHPDSIFFDYDGDIKAKGIPGKDPMRPENFESYGKRLFGCEMRNAGDALTNRHAEIAAYVQREAQNVMTRLAKIIHGETGLPRLCVAGGLALNSITNSIIRDEGLFDDIFIQPASTDTGIPLGCALYGYHQILGRKRFMSMEDAYFGRVYGRDEIAAALGSCGEVKWTRPRNLLQRCAKLLSRGKVLGWFHGGSELGPRALGHRSILADPRNPAMKDHLNSDVKHRESFRPFSPVVIREKTGEYFESDKPSPFMLHVAKARQDVAPAIPGVLHVDNTARLQTLERKVCPRLYDLILEFEKIAGVPMLLNTSFNDAGFPIVESPADALATFLSTEIDYLVLEDAIVEKRKARSQKV